MGNLIFLEANFDYSALVILLCSFNIVFAEWLIQIVAEWALRHINTRKCVNTSQVHPQEPALVVWLINMWLVMITYLWIGCILIVSGFDRV